MKLHTVTLLCLLTTGCGSDGGDKAGGEPCDTGAECASNTCVNGLREGPLNSSANNSSNVSFACGEGSTMCSGGQYCLVSQVNSIESAADCYSLPDCGQDACDCASDDAPNNSATCDGALVSTICNNATVIVTCNRGML